MSKCKGNCCVVFFPSSTIEEMRQELADGISGDPDTEFIVDMLIPLGRLEAGERYARLVPKNEQKARHFAGMLDPENEGRICTCRHFDEMTRRCTQYDKRPRMCSFYPYGKACEHDCGCKDGRKLWRERFSNWREKMRQRIVRAVARREWFRATIGRIIFAIRDRRSDTIPS